MKNTTLRFLVSANLLFILLTGGCLSLPAQGLSPHTQARLQAVIEKFQNDPVHPFVGGISAAIKVDGLALWQGTTGYAARNVDEQNYLLPGGTPFTTGTLSQIYSVTKTFTSALVLELAREGAFSLNDPVSKFLPLHLVNPGLNRSVTIRQLLAHESGYSNYTDEYLLQVAVAYQPTHIWTPFEMLYFVHQIKEPGAVRSYSSTNYIVLGAIIEAVTGKVVERHYRERFFTPLGLTSMYLSIREPLGDRGVLAAPHDNISAFNPVFQLTDRPTFPNAYTNIYRFPMDAILSLAYTGGGIVSDAADLAEWGNSLFGGRATSKATLDSMMHSISSIPDEDGDYHGYGCWVSKKISTTDYFIGHDGRAPGYRSVMFYQPDKKLTLVVLTNFYGTDPYAIARALYEALPDFLGGNENRKEDKILLCYQGNSLNVDRSAAPGLVKKGAYLGTCDQPETKFQTKKGGDPQEQQNRNNSLGVFSNSSTGQITFFFKIQQSGPVSLRLYNVSGKLVSRIFSGLVEKDTPHQVYLQGKHLPAGVYIGCLQTQEGISSKKLVIQH